VALQLSLGRADVPAVPSGEPDVAATGEPVPLRILLVEDNGVNRILTSRQVTRLGHQLDDVATGGEGVRAVLDRHYDVVLMDRHLPDIDGIEATRQIRAAEAADPRRRRTPIVAITADALAGHREECLAAGMDGFLTKPVDLEHLSAAIIAFTPRPQPASTKSSDVDVDLSTLERLVSQFDGDTVPVSEMVRTYVDELPTRGERLRLALSAATAHDALAAAASLHAASVTIGAVGVARRCELIRAAAEANDLAGGRAVLPGLLELCERTAAILDTVEATSAG
jgi:CheY-like chemotaxis protein